MKLKRTQWLTVHSRARTAGSTSRFSVALPDLLVEADPMTERVRIGLQSFQVPLTWYQIVAGRNTIAATNLATGAAATLTVPPGTYSYYELCRLLQSMYAPLSARYFPNSSTILLFAMQPHRWVFAKGLAEVMGFKPGVAYEGTSVYSPLVCQPLATTAIHVSLTNLPPCQDNLSLSNLTGEVTVDSTLAIVPVTSTQPFHVVTYTNDLDDGVFTGDHKLSVIEFALTNEDGELLADLPDHIMRLRLDTFEVDEADGLTKTLAEIKDGVQTLVLYKHIRS
jgi:hypothetical protein